MQPRPSLARENSFRSESFRVAIRQDQDHPLMMPRMQRLQRRRRQVRQLRHQVPRRDQRRAQFRLRIIPRPIVRIKGEAAVFQFGGAGGGVAEERGEAGTADDGGFGEVGKTFLGQRIISRRGRVADRTIPARNPVRGKGVAGQGTSAGRGVHWARGGAAINAGALDVIEQLHRPDALRIVRGRGIIRRRRKNLLVIGHVKHQPNPKLPGIREALDTLRFALGAAERGQKQAGEDTDNGNRDEKFNQRESPGTCTLPSLGVRRSIHGGLCL